MAGYICGCGAELKSQAVEAVKRHKATQGHQVWETQQPAPLPGGDAPPAPPPEEDTPAPPPAAEGIFCPSCGAGPFAAYADILAHEKGGAHAEVAAKSRHQIEAERREAIKVRVKTAELTPDLAWPVLAFDRSPQDRAKETRRVFASKGWPDDLHPGFVLDFLREWDIPVVEHVRRGPEPPLILG